MKVKVVSLFLGAATLATIGCGSGVKATSPAAEVVSTPIPPAPKKVVFIGDSVSYLWGNQPEFKANINWIDKGISGQTSTQIAMRFQQDVIAKNPDVVHIVAGTNDVYPGWELCSSGDGDATASTAPTQVALTQAPHICSNFLYMVETAKRNGIKVVIGTIPPWGCDTDPFCGLSVADETSSRYDRISQLNAWLKTFAVEEHIDIVDYHQILQNASGEHYAEGLTTDGVHPDANGYALMTPSVFPLLQ